MSLSFKNEVNGWINIYKHENISSAGIIRELKNIFKESKIGHAGTLDPMATGILPIAIGEATKTVQYLHEKNKTYIFNIIFGESTDTDDRTGNIQKTSDRVPSSQSINQFLTQYTGVIEQMPPIYSAKKINGQRAYAIARNGGIPSLKAKLVQIDKIKKIKKINEKEFVFSVTCGTGTYVRSIARDLGYALDVCCHVSKIDRIEYGPFNLKNILSIDRLMQLNHDIDSLRSIVKPINTVLDDILAVNVSNHEAFKLKNGLSINYKNLDAKTISGKVYTIYSGQIIAICNIDDGLIKPVRVFNL
jgi:tRNA pseudouridine55 synthase